MLQRNMNWHEYYRLVVIAELEYYHCETHTCQLEYEEVDWDCYPDNNIE